MTLDARTCQASGTRPVARQSVAVRTRDGSRRALLEVALRPERPTVDCAARAGVAHRVARGGHAREAAMAAGAARARAVRTHPTAMRVVPGAGDLARRRGAREVTSRPVLARAVAVRARRGARRPRQAVDVTRRRPAVEMACAALRATAGDVRAIGACVVAARGDDGHRGERREEPKRSHSHEPSRPPDPRQTPTRRIWRLFVGVKGIAYLPEKHA